jgi:hypothetical protein
MKTIVTSPDTLAPAQLRRRKSGFVSWIRCVLLVLLVLLIDLAAIGASYQAVATAIDQRTYPPPGQLVDVGGYKLHLNVQGQPTGQRGAVLACYASCCQALRNELGVEPSLETMALYQQIVSGDRLYDSAARAHERKPTVLCMRSRLRSCSRTTCRARECRSLGARAS